ncbi:MAG: hypothetical protein OHK0029_42340 [Armatimonadaceae bacterium]
MEQITIGIRITEDGLEFFGIEEVNELIAGGYRVSRIEPGNALVEEIEDEEGEEDMLTLVGCDMIVALEKPNENLP